MTTPAALPPLPFNPGRVRSYLVRLPLFTRIVLLAIIAFWLLEFQTIWSVVQWGALIPEEINLGTSMCIFYFRVRRVLGHVLI
jgi:glycosylphosphatidylinositol transamidase